MQTDLSVAYTSPYHVRQLRGCGDTVSVRMVSSCFFIWNQSQISAPFLLVRLQGTFVARKGDSIAGVSAWNGALPY